MARRLPAPSKWRPRAVGTSCRRPIFVRRPAGLSKTRSSRPFGAILVSSYDQHRNDGIDGIFLVLHGAMVCLSIPDVEGELAITRLRRLPGAYELPICGVLDLHGNISRRTIEGSQGFWAYRTNPHSDARNAAMNAATMLDRILKMGRKPTVLFESVPIMWPPTGTGTDDEPMRGLEAMAREIEKIAAVNVMAGFSFADTFDTGVSFSVVTFADPELREAASPIALRFCGSSPRIRKCDRAAARNGDAESARLCGACNRCRWCLSSRPTTSAAVHRATVPTILRTLLEHGVEGAAVVINDPASVKRLERCAGGGMEAAGCRWKREPIH